VLVSLGRDDGGVVLLIEWQVVDALGVPTDVALDPRVVLERDAFFDPNIELLGELAGPLGQCCRGRKGPGDFAVGVLDAGGDDSPEELEDVLLMDGSCGAPSACTG
jgi:hypothetical protein